MNRFCDGDRVRVREDYPPGHIRTPVYLRGKTGVVERWLGEFENPETAAYGRFGTKKGVYKIRFQALELWPGYQGGAGDCVDADLCEHWLERSP